MGPAHQGLGPEQPPGLEVPLPLVVHLEAAEAQRFSQLALPTQVGPVVGPRPRVVDLDGVPAERLGAVHGHVGPAQQLARPHGGIGCVDQAHARRDLHGVAGHLEGRLQGPDQAVEAATALGHGRRSGEQHQQLVAAAETGAQGHSAAWLIRQHGWSWDDHGHWTRQPHPNPSESARLAAGDLLLVDEAGMLDQDTAKALFTIADETGARVALVGDRHQLPAVGRGGVLDHAIAWAHPTAIVTLVELQNGDNPPSYVAGTENFYAITRYNWSSYYAMAVIGLGQAVAAARR